VGGRGNLLKTAGEFAPHLQALPSGDRLQPQLPPALKFLWSQARGVRLVRPARAIVGRSRASLLSLRDRTRVWLVAQPRWHVGGTGRLLPWPISSLFLVARITTREFGRTSARSNFLRRNAFLKLEYCRYTMMTTPAALLPFITE